MARALKVFSSCLEGVQISHQLCASPKETAGKIPSVLPKAPTAACYLPEHATHSAFDILKTKSSVLKSSIQSLPLSELYKS
jgi:hypothetical protein